MGLVCARTVVDCAVEIDDELGVGVMESDSLQAVTESLDHSLTEDIEWASKDDIVGR